MEDKKDVEQESYELMKKLEEWNDLDPSEKQASVEELGLEELGLEERDKEWCSTCNKKMVYVDNKCFLCGNE